MIIMNKRSCAILYELIERDFPMTIGKFANLFNVTTRTIRTDINEINRFLVQMDFPAIKTIKGGLILIDRNIDYTPIRLKLKIMGFYFYKMSQKERRSVTILILANEQRYITMSELSEKLYVSRQTIISDIAEIREVLYGHGISIVSQAHKGIIIQYDERNLRSLIVEILNEYSSNVRDTSIFGKMIFSEAASSYPIDEISKWMQKIEETMDLHLSDKGFHDLLIYFFVAINRISKNCMIEGENIKKEAIDENAFQLARNLYASFNIEYSLNINDFEVYFFAKFIQDNRIYPLSSNINNYPDVDIIVANFLYAIFSTLGINLSSRNSCELFAFLIFHIRDLAERINSKVKVTNPFCEQIKSEFVDAFNAVQENIYLIEEYLGSRVAQDEIAFITMHICAAIKRSQSMKPRLSIVVACPGSMATGQLLAAQIRNHFNFYICEIISADRSIGNFQLNKHDIDFVISSVELSECNLPYLVVNPILKGKDFNRIQSLAEEIFSKKQENIIEKEIPSTLNREYSKISSSRNNGQSKIGKSLGAICDEGRNNLSGKEEQPYLYEIIKPFLIRTNGKTRDWRSAITQGGNILVENGFVKPSYTNSMIAKVEEFGPYCVIVKGMALAHARSNNDVNTSGMSLLVLPNGVKFNHETNDPVYLLFCFCVNDNRDYLRTLTNLIALGKQKEFIPQILSTNSGFDVYEMIKQRELNLNKEKVVS